MKFFISIVFFITIDHLAGQENLGCAGPEFHYYIDSLLAESSKTYEEYLRANHVTKTSRSLVNPLFIWPLRATKLYQELPGYATVSNYVDLDPTEDEVIDYTCGERTYDGHRGHDITLFPFMWHMMNMEYVEVLAAADGVVTAVDDNNNNDNNCMGSTSSNTDNNTVIITHADGSRTIYYHIKTNSITVLNGQTVSAGDKIALVASSGYSTGPHLHFEVRDANNAVIEPNVGACNGTTTSSWFISQRPYWVPGLNRISCHYAEPSCVGDNSTGWCDSEGLFFRNNFSPGDDIFFGIALVDIQGGAEVEINVYDSNGNSIYSDGFIHIFDPDNALFHIFDTSLPNNSPSGTYKVRVDLGQDEYYHYFTVNCPESTTITSDLSGDNGFHAGTTLNISSLLMQSGFPLSYSNTELKLQSGSQIKLTPGFHAPSGTYVWTRLRGCNFTY